MKEQITRRELFSEMFSKKTLKQAVKFCHEINGGNEASVSRKASIKKSTKSLFETVKRLNPMNNRKEG